MAKKPPKRTPQQMYQAKYEASGKRPNRPITTRLTSEEVDALDRARHAGTKKEVSRSAWILQLIRRALGFEKE